MKTVNYRLNITPFVVFFMRLIFAYSLSILLFFHTACADRDQYLLAQHYIEQYKQLAVDEMFKMGVPASIKLAQGMLESDFGQSRLSNDGKNHFGIKCKTYWQGDTILIDDDAPQECFRRYNTVEESYIDHSFFLRYHPKHNYDHLFSLNKRDYLSWAWGLQDAGYATNTNYANGLINLIEKYELFRFDDYEQFYPQGGKQPAVLLPDENGYYAATAYKNNPSATIAQQQRPQQPPSASNKTATATATAGTNNNNHRKADKNDILAAALPKNAAALSNLPNPESDKKYLGNGKFIARGTPTDVAPQQPGRLPAAPATTMASVQQYEEPLSIRQLYVNGSLSLLANRQLSPIYVAYYYNISLRDLYKFNETQPGELFKVGSPVFLEPKSRKVARGQDVYIARNGETLYDIAQRFGVRLKTLHKRNNRYAAVTFKGGERVKLQ